MLFINNLKMFLKATQIGKKYETPEMLGYEDARGDSLTKAYDGTPLSGSYQVTFVLTTTDTLDKSKMQIDFLDPDGITVKSSKIYNDISNPKSDPHIVINDNKVTLYGTYTTSSADVGKYPFYLRVDFYDLKGTRIRSQMIQLGTLTITEKVSPSITNIQTGTGHYTLNHSSISGHQVILTVDSTTNLSKSNVVQIDVSNNYKMTDIVSTKTYKIGDSDINISDNKINISLPDVSISSPNFNINDYVYLNIYLFDINGTKSSGSTIDIGTVYPADLSNDPVVTSDKPIITNYTMSSITGSLGPGELTLNGSIAQTEGKVYLDGKNIYDFVKSAYSSYTITVNYYYQAYAHPTITSECLGQSNTYSYTYTSGSTTSPVTTTTDDEFSITINDYSVSPQFRYLYLFETFTVTTNDKTYTYNVDNSDGFKVPIFGEGDINYSGPKTLELINNPRISYTKVYDGMPASTSSEIQYEIKSSKSNNLDLSKVVLKLIKYDGSKNSCFIKEYDNDESTYLYLKDDTTLCLRIEVSTEFADNPVGPGVYNFTIVILQLFDTNGAKSDVIECDGVGGTIEITKSSVP